MKINADFSQRVIVESEQLEWQSSPMQGVHRRPLDRVGGEVARATTIVRYAPGSQFSPHVHTGGEEFLVLDGVFQDEHGDFPAGSYIRNPPESKHTPGSEPGCIIFVKLWQFEPEDRTHVRLRTDFMPAVPHRDMPGTEVIPLYQDTIEQVFLVKLEANTTWSLAATSGAELLSLTGDFTLADKDYGKHTWVRMPEGDELSLTAGEQGVSFWLKLGNLPLVAQQLARIPS